MTPRTPRAKRKATIGERIAKKHLDGVARTFLARAIDAALTAERTRFDTLRLAVLHRRNIDEVRATDEAEHAASGRTFSHDDIVHADKMLDAALEAQ